MSSPSSSIGPGFNLTKTSDTTKSVVINYLPIGLTSIFRDDQNNYITADCALSSTSNVTYTDNNVTTEYKANKLWIISDGEFTPDKTPMNEISGVIADAQLIIRNINSNGDKILFTCFPLIVKNPGPSRGAIDSIVRSTNENVTQMTVSLNSDIFQNQTPNTKYIEYTSTKGNAATVLLYGNTIEIISEEVKSLKNNIDLFNLQPIEYNIIGTPTPGEWMECDYVPIDSEEVATYNLPVSSQLVQDSAAHNSFKTMIMFIIFILLAIVCFSVIPAAYIFVLGYIFNYSNTKTPTDQRNMMTKINQVVVILFGIAIIQCFYIGVFADPAQYPNYAEYLLWGIILSVIIGVCYLIMESKKTLSKDWPIEEIQRDQIDT